MTIVLVVLVANFGKSGGPTEENRMKARVRDYHLSALGSDDRVDFGNDTGDGRTFTKRMLGEIQFWKCEAQARCLARDSSLFVVVGARMMTFGKLKCNGASGGCA